MASVEIASGASVAEGLEALVIPAQTYLVFYLETDGSDLHPQMQSALREIWGEQAPKSGFRLATSLDLEVYPPGVVPDQPAHIQWWIPIDV